MAAPELTQVTAGVLDGENADLFRGHNSKEIMDKTGIVEISIISHMVYPD